jgi:hypothetical protein
MRTTTVAVAAGGSSGLAPTEGPDHQDGDTDQDRDAEHHDHPFVRALSPPPPAATRLEDG